MTFKINGLIFSDNGLEAIDSSEGCTCYDKVFYPYILTLMRMMGMFILDWRWVPVEQVVDAVYVIEIIEAKQ